MTKLRIAGSFEDAALEAVRILGAKQAAAAASLSPKTVRDYTDPDRPGRPSLAKALAIDVACHAKVGRTPFLEAYSRMLATRTEQNERPVGELRVDARDVPGAVGRLPDTIRRSTAITSADGTRLSTAEAATIQRESKAPRREFGDIGIAVDEATNGNTRPARKVAT
jgi:hypothetical protein